MSFLDAARARAAAMSCGRMITRRQGRLYFSIDEPANIAVSPIITPDRA